MNCSSSVCRELGGRRACEAASDLHRYHTPFISDREVDFLECLRAWWGGGGCGGVSDVHLYTQALLFDDVCCAAL